MVPGTGVEPARPCGHQNLNLARLPIPPPGRPGENLGSGELNVNQMGVQALGGRGRPALSSAALLRRLGASRAEGKALRRTLRELVSEGKLERVERRYRLPRRDDLVEAVAAGGARVVDDAGTSWRIVAPAEALRPGQRVLVQPLGRRGRAALVSVLEAPRATRVGILSRRRNAGVVTPYRDDARWRVRIAARDLGGARDGEVVVIEARERGRSEGRRGRGRERGAPAWGRVVEHLGPPGTPEADFRAVVWRRRLPVAFPQEARAEAASAPERPEPAEVARRVDLRDRPFLTIDPATARDHDDAVCVAEEERGGARLWVAIADVSHYVAEGSAVDREALRRGNSVYFPDRAIPMLPERLTGDVCSLREGVDRLVLVVELVIDREGAVRRRSFYPAVIRSRARLSYEEASAVMEEGDPPAAMEAELAEQLRALARVALRLMERRFAAGSIDFDLPSAEIVLGDEGRPVDIVEAPRTLAHRAIEEAMLAANRAVAGALLEAGVATVYRVHEPPAPGDMADLQRLLEGFGLLPHAKGDGLSPLDLAEALRRVEGRPEERLVHRAALRSMRQARYAARNLGHFALAFEAYLHFTSPIRRYADLVVHRSLQKILRDGAQVAASELESERLAAVAARVSQRERTAMEAERELVDLTKCAFMARHVGREFDGTITGAAPHGIYVTLDAFAVDGLVPAATLPGEPAFDARAFALVARRGGRRYQLGDPVRIRVEGVNQVKAWITFSLLTHRNAAHSGASRRAESSSARRSQSR
jgi:ribonuclease R